MARLRVGVLGTSWWADGMHLPALASHESAVIAAVCGRDVDRAMAMAAKHGAEKVYTDWREMIVGEKLDAVIISTPDELHHPIAMAAIDKGLHVLCEKPLGLDAQQAHEMYIRAKERKLVTMTYFTFRWLKQTEEMKRLLEEDYVGKIQHGRFEFLAGGGRQGWRDTWRYDQRRANGALGDYGSHMIDMALWMCGDISKVSAHMAVVNRPPEESDIPAANESAILAVDFASGAHGTIRASHVELVRQNGFELHASVCGSAGKLELCVDMTGATLRGARGSDPDPELRDLPIRPEIARDVDFSMGIVDQKQHIFTRHSSGVRLFVDSILAGIPACPDFRDGWLAQVVMDAALESDATGRRITL